MIGAVIQSMALRLIRDRGALALAFVLPAFIYLVFASIFAGTTSGETTMRAGLVDISDGAIEPAVIDDLLNSEKLNVVHDPAWTRPDATRLLRDNHVDGVIMLTGSISAPDEETPVVILAEPSRRVAALSIGAEVAGVIAEKAPQLMMARQAAELEAITGARTPEQSARLEAALGAMTSQGAAQDTVPEDPALSANVPIVEFELVGASTESGESDSGAIASAAYYAGAVAIMFTLFACVHGAMIITEERENGVNGRLILSRADAAALSLGRLIFLAILCTLQYAAIFTLAALVFHVDVLGSVPALAIMTASAAFASAGLGLAVVSLFPTAQLAHGASSFLVLIVSAIGGSMAPRYLMPEWLQEIGAWTPNAWAIDGFYKVFAYQADAGEIGEKALLLAGLGAFGFVISAGLAYRINHHSPS